MDNDVRVSAEELFALKTVAEVAVMLHRKPVTVRRLVKKGKLNARLVGNKMLFTIGDLSAFLNAVATTGEKNGDK